MKKLLLLLFVLPCLCKAQIESPYAHLKLDNTNSIIFQAIFNYNSNTNIVAALQTLSEIKNVDVQGNVITFNLVGFEFNYKKYNIPVMRILYLLRHDIVAKGVIEIKDNRYRVTLSNLRSILDDRSNLLHISPDDLGIMTFTDFLTKKKGTEWNLTGLMVRKDSPYTIFKEISCLDSQLNDYFDFKTNDNW